MAVFAKTVMTSMLLLLIQLSSLVACIEGGEEWASVRHPLPVVINTWPFTQATDSAWKTLQADASDPVAAVVAGCSRCEVLQCDGSVGYGHHPDEDGEVTLDSMVMDGATHDVGAVVDLRRIKDGIAVAHAVMKYTTHTVLAGARATAFAVEMGFKEQTLETNASRQEWKSWKQNRCQPNYRQNVVPNPKETCGPYKPARNGQQPARQRYNAAVSPSNHDTIGMVVLNQAGNLASGTTTNGANHKVPGRVGDSPFVGAGSYVDNDAGGCAATGDGDVMMRFVPCFYVVEQLRSGVNVTTACNNAIQRIARFYPKFSGAVLAINKQGQIGASCHNFPAFPYSMRSAATPHTVVKSIACSKTKL